MNKIIIAILCLALAFNCFAQEEQEEAVTNFDYSTEKLAAVNVASGIEIVVNAGVEGKISFTPQSGYWDLTQWVFMSLELENKTEHDIRFDPTMLYELRNRKDYAFNEHIGFLHPQENLVFNCVLIRDAVNSADYPAVADFPAMNGIPNGMFLIYAGVDAKKITALEIVFPEQDFQRKVLLKRIFKKRSTLPQLYVDNKATFFPFIDKYGQYKHATWEGKITDDSDFTAAIVKEENDIAKHPVSPEWNRFGGFANGPKYEATGNFRTKKIDDKWWIIDPDGCLFWSAGVTGVGYNGYPTKIKDREHFFEGLQGQWSYRHGNENLKRKYGTDDVNEYVEVCLKRMKSWGLNTLGGWSNENINSHPKSVKLPYTVYINAMEPKINNRFPDVFDPKWTKDIEKSIQEKAALVKNDPYFFGFFINNETWWNNPTVIAKYSLEKDVASYGKQVYVALLQQRLSSIDEFNNLTGALVADWQDLLDTEMNTAGLNLNSLDAINVEHYNNMSEKFFKTTKDLIQQYAPGKMYLGCRWHGNHANKWNMPIAAKYLDIFSFNEYKNEVEFFHNPPENLDVPFIFTEFHFGALDRGMFAPGLGTASSQRNRGEKYKNYVQGTLRNSRCVGAHWFAWSDFPTTGRGDGENYNCGLVSLTDQIYYEFISEMREITHHLYDYRINGSTTAVSVIHSEHNEEFKISPNPTNSLLNIQPIISNINAEIFNLNGQQVWNGRIVNGTINIEQLKSGIYILQFADNKRQNIFKIIKN